MRKYTQRSPSGKDKSVEQHGKCKSLTYKSWRCMKSRCEDVTHVAYHRYGGRGITVCAEWSTSFTTFLEDMGERPSKDYTIERLDNDKGYTPTNCKWIPRKEQYKTKTQVQSRKVLELYGVKLNMSEWAKVLEVPYSKLVVRKAAGWTDEDTLTKPIAHKSKRHVIFKGETMSLIDFCARNKLNYAKTKGRINSGWSPYKCLK